MLRDMPSGTQYSGLVAADSCHLTEAPCLLKPLKLSLEPRMLQLLKAVELQVLETVSDRCIPASAAVTECCRALAIVVVVPVSLVL